MNKKLILLVALLFVFAIAAGTFYAVNAADDKAKSSTVLKDDCCKKDAADCQQAECCKKNAADCKEKAAAKEECSKDKTGCSKAKTESAASESKCAGCPAKSACEKK